MTNALKLLLIAAATIVTCAVICITVQLWGKGSTLANTAVYRIEEYQNDLNEQDILAYDGLRVTGSDVVNFMKKYLGEYDEGETAPIEVTIVSSTNPYTAQTYENGVYLEQIQSFADARYIKPIHYYYGKVFRNSNEVIIEVQFTVE